MCQTAFTCLQTPQNLSYIISAEYHNITLKIRRYQLLTKEISQLIGQIG